MRTRRVGMALEGGPGGAPATEFPGITIPEPKAGAAAWLGGSISFVVHGVALAALVGLAALSPPMEELIREVKLVREVAKPKPNPAPAPKALAERRPLDYAPAPQAIAPQVVNPRVVSRAAPAIAAERLQMDTAAPSVTPMDIPRAAVTAETVSAVRSVASAQRAAVDLGATSGPTLRGPIEPTATAVGRSAGPKQITSSGDTIGTGPLSAVRGGSSVREGIASDRDVQGSPTGARLASVNSRVGDGFLRGDGGTGTGVGGVSQADCLDRPEVRAYYESIRSRMFERWVLPSGISGTHAVTLRFRLDAAGSATSVELVSSENSALGQSAVDALRSASPFPPMGDRVRCLAGSPVVGKFKTIPELGG